MDAAEKIKVEIVKQNKFPENSNSAYQIFTTSIIPLREKQPRDIIDKSIPPAARFNNERNIFHFPERISFASILRG